MGLLGKMGAVGVVLLLPSATVANLHQLDTPFSSRVFSVFITVVIWVCMLVFCHAPANAQLQAATSEPPCLQ